MGDWVEGPPQGPGYYWAQITGRRGFLDGAVLFIECGEGRDGGVGSRAYAYYVGDDNGIDISHVVRHVPVPPSPRPPAVSS